MVEPTAAAMEKLVSIANRFLKAHAM
jgi:hypothetical protein